jgi:hypothetical protein
MTPGNRIKQRTESHKKQGNYNAYSASFLHLKLNLKAALFSYRHDKARPRFLGHEGSNRMIESLPRRDSEGNLCFFPFQNPKQDVAINLGPKGAVKATLANFAPA